MNSENSVESHSIFRSKRLWAGIVALTVIVALVILVIFCNPTTIIGTGTALTVPANSHVQYVFTRPSSGAGGVYGEFSSDRAVTMYVMDSTQFSQFNSTGYASSYFYSSGQVTLTIVGGKNPFVYLKQPGQYLLVFYNSGAPAATVTVMTTFSVETC